MIVAFCVILILPSCISELIFDSDCDLTANVNRSLSFTMGSRKNESGNWVTTASLYKECEDLTEGVNLEVKQQVIDCGGRHVLHIKGVLIETREERVTFHPRSGKNVAFSNNRRTASRKNDNENNGVVFTNSPLKSDRLFEVRLDKATTKFTYALGIGVTALLPDDLDIPDHMNTLRSSTWMYYDKRVFNNASIIAKDYGKNLNEKGEFQVGDHVGVKVKHPDHLHFFFNGVDQGPIKTKLPYSVYGVVELRGTSTQVSIIDRAVCLNLGVRSFSTLEWPPSIGGLSHCGIYYCFPAFSRLKINECLTKLQQNGVEIA